METEISKLCFSRLSVSIMKCPVPFHKVIIVVLLARLKFNVVIKTNNTVLY